MVDQASQIIQEIQQIKSQYVAEVGKGRRVWPRSIKERAARLDELGVPAKAVAKQTGISYETLILWRHHRRHGIGKFHEVKVDTQVALPAPPATPKNVATAILKTGTVTVPNFEIPPSATPQGLRLTMPNGFVVEGLDAGGMLWLINTLSRGGGEHAS